MELPEIKRWVTVLQESAVNPVAAPAFEVELKYVTEGRLKAINEGYSKRGVGVMQRLADRQFWRRFLDEALCNWRGLTRANLMRLSEYYLMHPDELKKFPEGEIEFPEDRTQRYRILDNMAPHHFQSIFNAAVDLESYAEEVIERQKNDFSLSSASP